MGQISLINQIAKLQARLAVLSLKPAVTAQEKRAVTRVRHAILQRERLLMRIQSKSVSQASHSVSGA